MRGRKPTATAEEVVEKMQMLGIKQGYMADELRRHGHKIHRENLNAVLRGKRTDGYATGVLNECNDYLNHLIEEMKNW